MSIPQWKKPPMGSRNRASVRTSTGHSCAHRARRQLFLHAQARALHPAGHVAAERYGRHVKQRAIVTAESVALANPCAARPCANAHLVMFCAPTAHVAARSIVARRKRRQTKKCASLGKSLAATG
jgi:hypothetical protein